MEPHGDFGDTSVAGCFLSGWVGVFSLGLIGGCSLSGWVGGVLSRGGWGVVLSRTVWGFVFFAFFRFFYGFRTCRVGHLEFAYLILHISNFSSKFCNIDCLTLHPPRAVVCRPLQTRADVHVLVVIIQVVILFQQYAISGTRTKVAAQKEVTAQRHEFLPA